MNLGQAVAICLYELIRETAAEMKAPSAVARADAEQTGRFTEMLLEILRESARFGTFPQQKKLSEFTKQTQDFETELQESTSGGIERIRRLTRYQLRRPVYDRFGEQVGTRPAGDTGQTISAAVGELTGGLVDLNKLPKALTYVADQVLANGASVGKALDQVAERMLTFSPEQERTVATQVAAVRKRLGPGASERDVQLAVRAGLEPDLAEKYKNVEEFNRQIYVAIARKFNLTEKLGIAGEDVTVSGSEEGDKFVNAFRKAFNLGVAKAIQQLQGAASPEAKAAIELLQKLLKASRPAFRAALATAAGRATIRDRVLEDLVAFNVRAGEINQQAESYGRLGLTFDKRQEEVQNGLDLLRRLGGLRAQTQGDLLRARVRLHYAKGQADSGDVIEGLGEGGRLQLNRDELQILKSTGGQEYENLKLRLEELKGVAETIYGNKELFQSLSKEEKGDLVSVLLGTGDIGQIEITVAKLLDAAERYAKIRADIVESREREQNLLEHTHRLELQQLETTNQVAQIRRRGGAGIAGLFGGPAAQFQVERANIAADLGGELEKIDTQFLQKQGELLNEFLSGKRGLGSYITEGLRAGQQATEQRQGAQGAAEARTQELETAFQLQRLTDYNQRVTQSIEQAISGIRQILTNPELLKKATPRDFAENLFGGAGQTLFAGYGNAFTDALFGPGGLLGGAAQTLFGGPASIQNRLIYDGSYRGTYSGIIDGLEASGLITPEQAATPKAGIGPLGGLVGKDKQAIKDALKSYAAVAGGTLIGNAISPHGNNNYSSEGAALGAAIGTAVPGIGTIVGGLVGGLLGGLFGKKRPPAPLPEMQVLERIDRNTRETISAIENQTTQLLTLDSRLLNVPSTFTVPGYRPLGVGGGLGAEGGMVVEQSVNITITDSRDPEATAQAVARTLRSESRRAGTFVSTRG